MLGRGGFLCAALWLVLGVADLAVAQAVDENEAPVKGGEAVGWDRLEVEAAMERLAGDIQRLTGLAAVQEQLLLLNARRVEDGELPVTLPLAMCADPALSRLCVVLPATFGVQVIEQGSEVDE